MGPGHDRRRGQGEEGVVVLLVSAAVVALLSLAAIVLDLGQAYVDARQLQTASDAAAMAGARELDKVRLSGASPSGVDTTVRLLATRNGAHASMVTCTIIRWDGTPIGPCSNPADVVHPLANGVLVSAGASRPTAFARALGRSELRVDRRAAATVQPLVGQDAPLLVCAFGQSGEPNILIGTPGSYTVNPLSVSHLNQQGIWVGPTYRAHAPHVADCGLHGSSWKGNAGEGPFVLPDWVGIGTGVKAGPVRSQIAGQPGCGATLTLGCVLVMPICSGSNGESGSNGQLFCERFGAFKLVAQTANTQDFRLLGPAEATIGIGGSGIPGVYDVRVVRLIA